MNNLSWIIYAADVIGSLILFLGLTGFALLCVSFGNIMYHSIENDDARLATTWKWAVPLAFFLFVVAILLPSRQTIILIAASQYGEHVAQTPEAKELANEAREALQRLIKGRRKVIGLSEA